MMDNEQDNGTGRLRALLDGSMEAPNEPVAYHVKQAQTAQSDHASLVQAIAKGSHELSAMQQRAVMLRAQLEAHLQAIAALDPEFQEQPTSEAAEL
jgi:hypothetical protein